MEEASDAEVEELCSRFDSATRLQDLAKFAIGSYLFLSDFLFLKKLYSFSGYKKAFKELANKSTEYGLACEAVKLSTDFMYEQCSILGDVCRLVGSSSQGLKALREKVSFLLFYDFCFHLLLFRNTWLVRTRSSRTS